MNFFIFYFILFFAQMTLSIAKKLQLQPGLTPEPTHPSMKICAVWLLGVVTSFKILEFVIIVGFFMRIIMHFQIFCLDTMNKLGNFNIFLQRLQKLLLNEPLIING